MSKKHSGPCAAIWYAAVKESRCMQNIETRIKSSKHCECLEAPG